ncbi:hypothetical protein SASPL_106114 [Salvia splendens]|uniref:Uncharacterized protein n=1 Tax=Salvia splendens TaxID=180675 RepID=A0A8X9A9A4_SALSN|nr:hypothetical protein SASPL_106114 [Salvia splendens]
MEEGSYVKLTEDQIALQNITPGELNQPIDIEKVHGRTCELCGQTLPVSYVPPADEDWATGIFGCLEDSNSFAALTMACNGMIDPDTVCLVTEGLLFAWWVCAIYSGMGRQLLQRKYHLKDSPCDPCAVHCCLHWCAICQEHREMKHHLSEESAAIVDLDPPQLQEMINAAAAASANSQPNNQIVLVTTNHDSNSV